MLEVTRVPLSFKSSVRTEGTERSFRHIVLAVRVDGQWGALGISRRSCLMFKDAGFNSLSALIEEFKRSYELCFHTLTRVYVGLPFTHDVLEADIPIRWRVIRIVVDLTPWEAAIAELDSYETVMCTLADTFAQTGTLPAPYKNSRPYSPELQEHASQVYDASTKRKPRPASPRQHSMTQSARSSRKRVGSAKVASASTNNLRGVAV
jgi:hypothetical protein